MDTRNVRRKNRKIKFSEDQYIEKYYMENGKAVIPLQLDKPTDLYMEHDYKQMQLSDSVCKYIEEIAYMVPVNIDIVIEVHCDNIDTETQEKMKRAIRNNFGMEIDDIEYDIKLQNHRSLILLIIGIVILTANILLDPYISSIASNFLSVVWWVAIWDMIEYQTLDKADYKWERLNYQQLYDAEITFKFD